MAQRYISDHVKLLLTLAVLLMFVISKTKGDNYVIRNIGIKLCELKCAEQGQCVSFDYDIETLTCRLSRDESKTEKREGHLTPARSHLHIQTGSCVCGFGERCLKTRSGKEVCVQDWTAPSPNTVPPAPVTTHDIQASTTDACEDLLPSKTVPPAPLKTQDSDPHTTPSPANRYLYYASKDGDLERVKRILAAGHVNINTKRYSMTLVMAAARYGHNHVVEFLVGRGADVSLVDMNGDNVLHYACQGRGNLEMVKMILSLNKVDINARNNDGKTAADLARHWRQRQIVDLLVSRGAH